MRIAHIAFVSQGLCQLTRYLQRKKNACYIHCFLAHSFVAHTLVAHSFIAFFLGVMLSLAVHADGLAVGKVYEPYVQPLEQEIEYRLVSSNDDTLPDVTIHKLGYGRALNDRWFAEFYIVSQYTRNHSADISGYELELKTQLTEQGEYGADWGLLFELEKEPEQDIYEFSTALLTTLEIGQWTANANTILKLEWGDDIEGEQEFEFRSQLRYRYSSQFEPAVELHLGQDTFAAGPVLRGSLRQGRGRKWFWDVGIFGGLDETTPDFIVKAALEFEFN